MMFLLPSDSLNKNEEAVTAQYTVTFKHIANSSYNSYLSVFIYYSNSADLVYGLYGGQSESRDLPSGAWARIVIPSTATTNRWVYAYGINGDSTRNHGVNEFWFQVTSACTVSFGVESGECWPFQTYDANGGSLEAANTSSSANAIACYLNGRYYRKNRSEWSLIGWRQRQEGWTGALLVGKTATSIQMNTTGDYSSTTTGYSTFSYDSNGDGSSETWYVLEGGPDYNYHTDQVSYSGGRSFVSLWWYSWVIDGYYVFNNSPTTTCALAFLDSYKTYSNIMNNTYYFPYADPVRPGYTFAGWYTSATGGTKVTEGASCSSNTTLYAHWTENTYTLCLEHPSGFTEYYDVSYTDTFTLPTEGSCSDGYHLSEWRDEYGVSYSTGEEIDVSYLVQQLGVSAGDYIYLFGQQSANTYVFTFDANGGTGEAVEISGLYTGSVTLPPQDCGISRTGYTLTGWALDSSGSGWDPEEEVLVSILASGYEYSGNNTFITMYAIWEINTYTLTIKYNTYYDENVHPTDINVTSTGGTFGGSQTISRGETTTITATYSTTPITVNWAHSNRTHPYYIQYYVGGSWGSSSVDSLSYTWTPTADVGLTTDVIEYFYYDAEAGLGISSAQAKSDWNTLREWTSKKTSDYQGSGLTFKATLDTGYVFDGWYNESGTRLSTDLEYIWATRDNPDNGDGVAGGLREDLTLTAKATKIYNKILYDSSGKYFYFEDGNYPQTYAGWGTTQTLTTQYNNGTITAAYNYMIGGSSCPVVLYSGSYYARVYCPKTVTVVSSGQTSAWTFSAGTYYWFKMEPIRWRVSDYGVSEDYYSTTLYSRFVNAGCVNGVSEYVLDYASMVPSGTKVSEGWKYTSSALHSNIRSNDSNASCLTYLTTTKSFDYLNNSGTNKKVLQESLSIAGFHQASINDIDKAGITNYKAKPSDLASMLSGVSVTNYCDYSTRDLYDLQNSKAVSKSGIVCNRWLDSPCGVRLAYSSTGKSS